MRPLVTIDAEILALHRRAAVVCAEPFTEREHQLAARVAVTLGGRLIYRDGALAVIDRDTRDALATLQREREAVQHATLAALASPTPHLRPAA
jgi:hypothetical protein